MRWSKGKMKKIKDELPAERVRILIPRIAQELAKSRERTALGLVGSAKLNDKNHAQRIHIDCMLDARRQLGCAQHFTQNFVELRPGWRSAVEKDTGHNLVT